MKFQFSAIALGCIALLSGCGGGGGSDQGTKAQFISFPFPGGQSIAIPPNVATVTLAATASGGGEVTYTSNTPDTCTVNGATLTLVKAGECSVTANQAGGNGYAPTSERQLFVIPKQLQKVIFRNPGWQPLDTTPVPLAATSDIANHPVTFSSSTPTACTVSGNSMTKVGNGMCTITATQAGDDIYATTTVVRNIPIGTAQADALTFLTGYKDSSHTNEQGGIGGSGSTSENGWWCNGFCSTTVDASANTFTFDFTATLPKAPDGRWIGGGFDMFALAAGLPDLVKNADTLVGTHIDAQAAIKFNFAQNPEWFSSSDNKVNVKLILGHHAMVPDGTDDKGNPKTKDCNVTLQSQFTPTAAAATNYSVSLRSFTIVESCGMTGLDPWIEMQDYPISKVDFAADGSNVSVPLPGTTATVRTRGTLTGAITFQ
jgi:hypothetical protein